MKVTADYHTHTIYSHGKGTIEENVKCAIMKGLKTIAIADHGPKFLKCGITKLTFKKMREEVDTLQIKYEGVINVLLGIEANIVDIEGNLDVDEEMINDCDILLAGFHFDIVHQNYLAEVRSKMKRRQQIKSVLDKGLFQEIVEFNTQALMKAMEKYNIGIITHPYDNHPIDISKISKKAGKTNTVLEINNYHIHPNAFQIKEAMQCKNTQFVINSDSHRPMDVGTFDIALKVVEESGLNHDRIINLTI